MNVIIEPGMLHGSVLPPPSKSHVHRLLIAASLCTHPKEDDEETLIVCPEENQDIAATIRCMEAINCMVQRQGKQLQVFSSVYLEPHPTLDCGESGSTLRFFLPICAAYNFPGDEGFLFTGKGRLPSRPNAPLLFELRRHGAKIEGDMLPLTVRGGLKSGDFALPGDVSSQYFTGLLFALPLLAGDSTLRYTSPLESMPYVELTLSVLRQFGIRVESMEDGWRVPGNQRYSSPGVVVAEGDWSAAAFWMGANHLGSQVSLLGMNDASAQGDRAIVAMLSKIGGEIDVTDTPDLMPVLSAVAAAIPGKTTRIIGAARLRLKESDRLSAMVQVICALGGQAEETADGVIVTGCKLRGGTVDGMNDHRIVMSAAIVATVCQGPVTILGAEAVNKSYPRFFEDFARLGGIIDVR